MAIVVGDIGRTWPIKWPSKSHLEKYSQCKILDDVKEERNERKITLKVYFTSGKIR